MTIRVGDKVRLRTGTAWMRVTHVYHDIGRIDAVYGGGHEQRFRDVNDFIKYENDNEKEYTMNTNSALVSLLQGQRGMTTVKVRLSGTSQVYTYKKMPGMALEVKDRVVVQTQRGMSIGEVKELDGFADIDLESGITYKWVVQKIDSTQVNALVEEEARLSKQLAAAEAQTKLNNLAKVAGIDLSTIATPMLSGSQ